jgi:hypothetical protein
MGAFVTHASEWCSCDGLDESRFAYNVIAGGCQMFLHRIVYIDYLL